MSAPDGAWVSNQQGTVSFNSVAFGNGFWTAVGGDGTLWYRADTPDGAWISNPQGTTWFFGVAFGNGFWVAVGDEGTLWYRGVAGWSFSLDAVLNSVSKCVWTTPGDTVQINPDATLHFLMPRAAARNMHFEIQIDTVDTFYGVDLRIIKSHSDLTGWEFWDGGTWQPINQAGVSNSYCGNEARYTIQTPLGNDMWYRRVRAGVI